MTRTELSACIEHSILQPDALPADVHRVVTEAMQHGFAAVVVPPVWLTRVATMLRGDGNNKVKLHTVVSFPHGTSKSTLKAIEATSSIKDGADAIELVPFLPNLIRADLDAARFELMEIVRAARATRRDVTIRIIVETALLMKSDDPQATIAAACRAVRESGCDGVVTSTGFHPAGGASVEAVALLKQYGEALTIKAAGGIDAQATAEAMLASGADRVGITRIF
jgi:deoxyribose-phosphate aldolase